MRYRVIGWDQYIDLLEQECLDLNVLDGKEYKVLSKVCKDQKKGMGLEIVDSSPRSIYCKVGILLIGPCRLCYCWT